MVSVDVVLDNSDAIFLKVVCVIQGPLKNCCTFEELLLVNGLIAMMIKRLTWMPDMKLHRTSAELSSILCASSTKKTTCVSKI